MLIVSAENAARKSTSHRARVATQEGIMAKFYVQSGAFRGIVDSYDEESAAVWAIHHVMEQAERMTAGLDTANAEIGLFRLGDEIGVSERGFRRRDRIRIPTHHAFARWVQLLHSIEMLQDKLNDAFDR